MQPSRFPATERNGIPSPVTAGKWGRRAVMVVTCSFLGVAIAGIERWLFPRSKQLHDPTTQDPTTSEWHAITGPAGEHLHGTLEWARAANLDTDRYLAAEAFAFVAVVLRYPQRRELSVGCRRLIELAIAGEHGCEDAHLHAGLSGMEALGLIGDFRNVNERLRGDSRFPKSLALLLRHIQHGTRRNR